ncbi:unnamed protein product [Ceratitis capitata]|uniref:(Mediterranean fruit fly) hypothetical protein n=1 Tax=Ceratitis capitata TaxID=7213 RepID=A0A811V610_CERCA|nr:unnamed protein product [Ceratitis capitata]
MSAAGTSYTNDEFSTMPATTTTTTNNSTLINLASAESSSIEMRDLNAPKAKFHRNAKSIKSLQCEGQHQLQKQHHQQQNQRHSMTQPAQQQRRIHFHIVGCAQI